MAYRLLSEMTFRLTRKPNDSIDNEAREDRMTDDEWAHIALRRLIHRALIDAETVLQWIEDLME